MSAKRVFDTLASGSKCAECGPEVKAAVERAKGLLEEYLRTGATGQPPGFFSVGEGFYAKRAGADGTIIVFRIKYAPISTVAIRVAWFVDILNAPHRKKPAWPTDFAGWEAEIGAVEATIDWDEWLGQITGDEGGPTSPRRKALPQELINWDPGAPPPERDWYLFMTRPFVEGLQKLPPVLLGSLVDCVGRLAASAQKQPVIHPTWQRLGNTPFSVLYGAIRGHLLLFELLKGDTDGLEIPEPVRKRWKSICAREKAGCDIVDALGQHSVLGVPALVLADDALAAKALSGRTNWIALSTDEIAVLNHILHNRRLPAFVQGRAGSGKSTVLYHYAAALACHMGAHAYHATRSALDHGSIVLVTQSKPLTHVADAAVQELAQLGNALNRGVGARSAPIAVHTFHDYCRALLSPSQADRFADDGFSAEGGYISAAHFRSLYTGQVRPGLQGLCFKSPVAKKIPWEAAWYAIRAYIKGYSPPNEENQNYLDPDSYSWLPTRHRGIPVDMYAEIYEQVFLPWYYRLTCEAAEGGTPPFWDSTDLARAVILNAVVESDPERDAVVLLCDEAQDFSRVEILALLRRLVWTGYDIRRAKYPHLTVPVVFAGDPFQTVDPSGFRWRTLSATINTALVVGLEDEGGYRIEELELLFNYRNPRAVAKLGNLIQFARRRFFDHEARPQRLWRFELSEVPIGRLVFGDRGVTREALRRRALVIVPERETDSSEPSNQGALSGFAGECLAADVKGLEFPVVVVAGFGEFFVNQKWHRLWQVPPSEWDEKERFALEYFFNCLYVAISRPTERLFIADTPEAIEKFWEPLARLPSQMAPSEREQWGDAGLAWVEATIEEIDTDFRRVAETLWQSARLTKDSSKAGAASHYYRLIGQVENAERALAYADYWDGFVAEAAKRLVDLGTSQDLPVAVVWFLEAGQWGKAEEVAGQCAGKVMEAAGQIAAVLARGVQNLDDAEMVLENVSMVVDSPLVHEHCDRPKQLLRKIATSALAGVSDILDTLEAEDEPQLRRLWNTLDSRYRGLFRATDELDTLARIAFRLAELQGGTFGDIAFYDNAVRIWDEAGLRGHGQYCVAQARLAEARGVQRQMSGEEDEAFAALAEAIEWWSRVPDHQRVLQLFESWGKRGVGFGRLCEQESSRAAHVVHAYYVLEKLDDAFVYAVWLDARTAAGIALESGPKRLTTNSRVLFDKLVQRMRADRTVRNWEALYRFRLRRFLEELGGIKSGDLSRRDRQRRLWRQAALVHLIRTTGMNHRAFEWLVAQLSEEAARSSGNAPVLENPFLRWRHWRWFKWLIELARERDGTGDPPDVQPPHEADNVRAAAALGAFRLLFQEGRVQADDAASGGGSSSQRIAPLWFFGTQPRLVTERGDRRIGWTWLGVYVGILLRTLVSLPENFYRRKILRDSAEALARYVLEEVKGPSAVSPENCVRLRPAWRLLKELSLTLPGRQRLREEVGNAWASVDDGEEAQKFRNQVSAMRK